MTALEALGSVHLLQRLLRHREPRLSMCPSNDVLAGDPEGVVSTF